MASCKIQTAFHCADGKFAERKNHIPKHSKTAVRKQNFATDIIQSTYSWNRQLSKSDTCHLLFSSATLSLFSLLIVFSSFVTASFSFHSELVCILFGPQIHLLFLLSLLLPLGKSFKILLFSSSSAELPPLSSYFSSLSLYYSSFSFSFPSIYFSFSCWASLWSVFCRLVLVLLHISRIKKDLYVTHDLRFFLSYFLLTFFSLLSLLRRCWIFFSFASLFV